LTEIAVAVITGVLALAGVILTNRAAANRMRQSIETAQAVTDTKLEELTREVRAHNHFAERMPVVEEQIRGLDRRVEELESVRAQAHSMV